MSTKGRYKLCGLTEAKIYDKNGETIINTTDQEILKTIAISIDGTDRLRTIEMERIGFEIQIVELKIEKELRRENEYSIEFYEKMAKKYPNNKRLSELVEELKRLDTMKKSIDIKNEISIINGK